MKSRNERKRYNYVINATLLCAFLLSCYSIPYAGEEENIWTKEKGNGEGSGEGIA
jgi:hypothetical protein